MDGLVLLLVLVRVCYLNMLPSSETSGLFFI